MIRDKRSEKGGNEKTFLETYATKKPEDVSKIHFQLKILLKFQFL